MGTDLRGDTHVRGYNLKQQPLRHEGGWDPTAWKYNSDPAGTMCARRGARIFNLKRPFRKEA